MKKYWLMKSEPDEFGIHHLIREKNQSTIWSGVRNYQVRNMIRDQMKPGDLGFFYHSSCSDPGIYGVVEVTSLAYPDPTQFNKKSSYYDSKSTKDEPRWLAVDVRLVTHFSRPILLSKMRQMPELEGMLVLAKGSRLSVTPVLRKHWDALWAEADANN